LFLTYITGPPCHGLSIVFHEEMTCGIERVEFEDGTVRDVAGIESRIIVTPATEGQDTLNGSADGDAVTTPWTEAMAILDRRDGQ
jgi:hypothetical protein